MGVIKYVDFGAAKIIAKNHRTMQRSRRQSDPAPTAAAAAVGTPAAGSGQFGGVNNSLTGTPMYMSPEVIRNNKRGRQGAMDIWSLGCVVLECATGRKPWSNLDNEWCVSPLGSPSRFADTFVNSLHRAIMFHIGVATQHPPLPDPGQLSEMGIDFIRQCLTIDPVQRPTALELMNHPWILDFREKLRSYEEEAEPAPTPALADPAAFEHASVARQAALLQERETELIQAVSPSLSPLATPEGSTDSSSSPDPQGSGTDPRSSDSSGGTSSPDSNSS